MVDYGEKYREGKRMGQRVERLANNNASSGLGRFLIWLLSLPFLIAWVFFKAIMAGLTKR